MKLLSKLLLTAVLLLGIPASVVAMENCVRLYLDSVVTLRDSSVSRIVNAGMKRYESISVEARAALRKSRERAGMSKTRWGVMMSSPGDTLDVCLHFGNTDFGDMFDRRIAVIIVRRNSTEIYRREAEGFRMSANGLNTLSINLTDSRLSVSGGGERSLSIAEIALEHPMVPEVARVWSEGELLLTSFATEVCRDPAETLDSGFDMESLRNRFRDTRDPIEGFWSYFDRTNNPSYARLGGRYTLALVRRDDGTYDIIYVSGAQTLASSWKPMMLKGSLRPTIFENHYDLTWIDATLERLTEDIHATIESNNSLLTLSFPLLKTTIRFSKVK